MSDEPVPQTQAATSPLEPSETRKPRLSRRALGWLLRVVLLVGLFVGISSWQQSDLLPLGQLAPDFQTRTVEGAPVRLSDYRGKAVVLHFWATWCGVCQQEFPMLNRLQASLGDDAVLLSVVADGDNPQLSELVEAQGLSYPVLRATRGLLKQYRIGAFPTNYFIDEDGAVRGRSVGLTTAWAMKSRLSCAR